MLTWEDDLELHALRKRGWTITAVANHAKLDRKTAPAATVLRWGDKRGSRPRGSRSSSKKPRTAVAITNWPVMIWRERVRNLQQRWTGS